MSRLARLAAASLTLLAIPSCMSAEDAPSASAPTQVFQPGDPASIQRAEQLTWQHLARLEPGLADSLVVRRVQIDAQGNAFTRLTQTVSGIPVFGAEAIVKLTPSGAYDGIVDKLARDLRVDTTPAIDAARAVAIALQSRGLAAPVAQVTSNADLQILAGHGKERLAYRVQLDATAAAQPTRPVVFVDAKTGAVLWSYDNLQTAKNRELHNLNHGTALPGPLARVEGGAATGDTDVDTNYGLLGWTYDCYFGLYGRDSINNAGAKLISSVHYSNNYVNAFWDGTQMVYGDGDNVNSVSLAISMDVTAHELTHAVTENESNLTYSGESGGLNESMSDIFGNVCEWYRDNNGNTAGPTSPGNFLVGEEIWLADPALRYMADPATDGASLDFWTSTAGNVDVHYSSGISNLAFYLLSQGGTHPRGKSSTVVTGIGIKDAGAIFYRANANYLTPSSTFADARAQTVKAATDLFGAASAQVAQTTNAWTAVGVLPPPDYVVIDTKTNLSGATGSAVNYSYPANGASAMKFSTSGGTGDPDLYVKFGSPPTLTSYDCRPYTAGPNENCEFNPAQSGTYYVMIQGYAAYSGVTLTVNAAGAGAPTTETSCTDGVDNEGDGAIDCADSDCVGDAACGGPTWGIVTSDDFEAGLGSYTLGGANASRVAANANSGAYSVRLRNGTATSSFATTTGMNLAGKTQLRVQYSMVSSGMEAGKSYAVELQVNGGAWTTIGSFASGSGFTDGVRQAKDLRATLSGTTNVKIRFRNAGSTKNDEVYIDDVVVSSL